jgi:aspartate kinase
LPPETPGADRERDALLSCGEGISASLLAAELEAQGIRAVSLHGSQLGLFTDRSFGDAEVIAADPALILHYLNRGCVVVAAGFHGMGEDGAFHTLGRGGSDTTAVALAAAMKVKEVIFYKDVEALCNADPRLVPGAAPLDLIPYDEAAHLAYEGAGVLHPRSADLAKQHGISIRIRNLEGRGSGTLITSMKEIRRIQPENQALFAVTCLDKIGQITAEPKARTFDFSRSLLEKLAEARISLDMINILEDRILFTMGAHLVEEAARIVGHTSFKVHLRKNCSKVSLLGGGIHGVPGIMSKIVSALAAAEVPIYQSVDTYTVISVLVEERHGTRSVQALHKAFDLNILSQPHPTPKKASRM